MPVSIFDIVSKGAELANKDAEIQKAIGGYDGDRVCFRFTDDAPVTLLTNKGKIAVESRERPDSQVILEMGVQDLCKILDGTMDFSQIRNRGRIVKGEIPKVVELMFAFLPFFDAMVRYYSENSEFRKMVDGRKSRKQR